VRQPGYDTTEDGRTELRYFEPGTYDLAALDTIGDLGPLTRSASGASLVVWPEAAIWVDPRRDPLLRPALQRLAAETGAALVVPFFLPDRAQGATVLVTPNGAFSRTQPKQRPMWFLGENGDNKRPPTPVGMPGGRLGTLLGVDDQDPASARRLAARGATVLTSSTHDWQQLAAHHRAHAQLQSRATGPRSSAPTGASARPSTTATAGNSRTPGARNGAPCSSPRSGRRPRARRSRTWATPSVGSPPGRRRRYGSRRRVGAGDGLPPP
jgi:hypothetical protein